jgi:hypothetical protein
LTVVTYLFSEEAAMKQSDIFRENADNCAHLAEATTDERKFLRYKRMEAAWLALANEQDWLDGEISPAASSKNGSVNGQPVKPNSSAKQID